MEREASELADAEAEDLGSDGVELDVIYDLSEDPLHFPHEEGEVLGEGDFDIEVLPPQKDRSGASVLVFVAAFFVTVATVLGTGILGLPVKLWKSGFTPFVATYSVCYVMQTLLICFMTEILQHASLENSIKQTNNSSSQRSSLDTGPDLHLIGDLYLHPLAQKVFNICVMLHFITILVSYSLAGAQAYGQLLSVTYVYLIPPFVVLLTVLVIFGSVRLHNVISLMTLAKGCLLILLVVVTAVVASESKESITNNWRYVGHTFLIGTVALGGTVNLMPVVFANVGFSRRDVLKFLIATCGGLLFVFVLNVLWAYFVLRIVPQSGSPYSLERSEHEGEISTVPLIDIIESSYPKFRWIAKVIDLFIVLSITVSYITLSIGLKHNLDGYIKSFLADQKTATEGISDVNHAERLWYRFCRMTGHLGVGIVSWQVLLYLTSFGLVLGIALTNPKGFVVVLERFTSLALNMSTGVFVAWMLGISRQRANDLRKVPLVLPQTVYIGRWVVLAYFSFAVGYDIITAFPFAQKYM